MVKMRIPIREQLGCLVLLSSLIGLAVIAIATWITNHHFVLDIRSSALSLTASLKSAQLTSNLLVMETTARQTASRLAIQSALSRYINDNNNTDANWSKARDDFSAIFTGEGDARLAVQVRLYARNSSETVLVDWTKDTLEDLPLPFNKPDGKRAMFGDNTTVISDLYPKFRAYQRRVNGSFSQWLAEYEGRNINANNLLISGPYAINETLSLLSMTMPIINNTSNIDTLGWLTIVMDANLIRKVVDSLEGLQDTGLTLIIGPNNVTNKFPSGVVSNPDAPQDEKVRFVLPPTNRSTLERHEANDNAMPDAPFNWDIFPAVREGFTVRTGAVSNAGSAISTYNEVHEHVAIGYALVQNNMVDWMVAVEQSHGEVWAPINRLRTIILACVFGTMGALMILAFPVAHYSSRPIRLLRDATKRSVSPHVIDESSMGSEEDGANDAHDEAMARKEGWIGSIVHYRRNQKASRAERREAERRRQFRIPAKVKDRKHFIHDELTDLTKTFNAMTDELMMQYERLEERVQQRTAELEQSKKAAEAANESKTLFIANISHELKTPLNGILGMCAVCMSEDDPIKLKRSLGIIYKSGDLLLNLLTDLLTFSKNQVGQQISLDEKEFRLRDISSQVMAIFDRQSKEGKINLTVRFEGPHDANVDENGRIIGRGDLGPFGLGRLKDMILYGDQHRILQVVINLVSNSLKFTPEGGTVTMSIRCFGEAQMSDSRKASLQSRHSSTRGSKRARGSASEIGSVAQSITTHDRYDTANVINAHDKSAFAHIMAQERSATPPPHGRWLSFEFEVEDTGPGIPENLHDKIFEPFVQGDLGLSKKYGGTGLGLSICSQLAGLMKGTISLQSEVGKGSTFTMAIPLKHLTSRADSTASSSNVNLHSGRQSINADDPTSLLRNDDARSGRSVQSAHSAPATATQSAGPIAFETDSKPRLVGLSQPFFASNTPLESPNSQAAAMQRVEAEATQRGDKVRVLVAEDNKTNQEVVLRMLKLEDVYDVTVAKDGQEALDKVKESMERNTPYNLIFMDVQMPNLDGLQSTRLIREFGFDAPIVALTAYAEEQNVKECLDSGMNYFLSKPIRRPALKHVLKTYCPPIPEEEGETTPPPSDRSKGKARTKASSANGGVAQSAQASSSTPSRTTNPPFANVTNANRSQNSPAISPLSHPSKEPPS